MKKKVSFRLFLTVIWRSVCQVFSSIGKFFGCTGKGYGKVIWCIASTCMTLLLLCFTVFMVSGLCLKYSKHRKLCQYGWTDTSLSSRFVYQVNYYNDATRIYDRMTERAVMEDVDWVLAGAAFDSLVVFAKDGKRGYFNRFTGEVPIPADTYTRAWIFSEGLAAVCRKGKLQFIDRQGKVVIDKGYDLFSGGAEYVFTHGYCLVKNTRNGKTGLLDHEGNWALLPEYNSIELVDSVWIVANDKENAVLSPRLQPVLPFAPVVYSDGGGTIIAEGKDHVARRYSLEGELLDPFLLYNVTPLTYNENQLHRVEEKTFNDDGEPVTETASMSSVSVEMPARCCKYIVPDYHCGLMAPDGTRLTPPDFTDITALGPDLYLCEYGNGSRANILLNSKGEQVDRE